MAILPPSNGGTPTSSSGTPPRVQTARSRTKKLSDFDAYAFSTQVSYSPPRSSQSNSPRSTGSPLSPRSTERKRLSDLEVYNLSSQVVYSPLRNNSPQYSPARSDTGMSDHNTVISHKTSSTQRTSSTVSTRSRRPGQAQVRLQQQQKAMNSQQSVASHRSVSSRSSSGSRQRGWHETMKQAASVANRKWEPKRGFEPEHGNARSYPAGASVADTQSISTIGASTPPRDQYSAPLMIDIEGENERMNVFDNFFDASRYGEI